MSATSRPTPISANTLTKATAYHGVGLLIVTQSMVKLTLHQKIVNIQRKITLRFYEAIVTP